MTMYSGPSGDDMRMPGGPSAEDLEAHAERMKELSGRVIELSRRNGLAWLEAYEKMLDGFLTLQQQAARTTQVDWINTMVQSNADMVRQMSQAYVSAMREQLK